MTGAGLGALGFSLVVYETAGLAVTGVLGFGSGLGSVLVTTTGFGLSASFAAGLLDFSGSGSFFSDSARIFDTRVSVSLVILVKDSGLVLFSNSNSAMPGDPTEAC